MALGRFLGRCPELTAEQRPQHGEADLDRQHRQGNQGEQPAVDHHHHDDDRERGIQDRGESLTGEEIADLLQLRHPGAQLPHRTAIEIAQGQQQVVDHLAPAAGRSDWWFQQTGKS